MTSILAISGGPDSVYLLHTLLEQGEKPILAHLNHQLRGQTSDEDEAFIKQLAKKHNLLCEIKRIDLALHAKTHKLSLETAGRTVRYEFLEQIRHKHNADHIYLAHNLNDNVETVLMNQARGCRLRGRIGMREKNNHLRRPLLSMPKSDILAQLRERKIPFRIDPSNQDTRFRRNHIRHIVIPKLLAQNPNLLEDFQKERAEALLDYETRTTQTKKWLQAHPDCLRRDFLDLNDDDQQFLLHYMYTRHHGSTVNLTTPQLREVQKMIRHGHGGKHRTLGKNLVIRLQNGKIHFQVPRT